MANPQVRIKTNYGSMTAELFADRAPDTVANFLNYVRDGFYENTLFHRTIANFMIQGGGLERGMYLKTAGAAIANEAANGLKNEKFTVAMARLPDPHSATCQFFVNVAANEFLDFREATDEGFGYCVFGRLTAGVDVAVGISEAATEERAGHQNVPQQDIVIETIEIVPEETENGGEGGDTKTDGD